LRAAGREIGAVSSRRPLLEEALFGGGAIPPGLGAVSRRESAA